MNSKSVANEQQESMEEWAKRMGNPPYPNGTIGYLVLSFLSVTSWWTVLLSIPLFAWIEHRASAKSRVKGLNVS